MMTRRDILRTGAAGALVTPFAGFAARAQQGPFRFGVLADPQYAPVPPRGTRFYSHSLWKLSEAVADFNGQELAFAVTLGDIIDRHWESYAHILPVYDQLAAPNVFVLGNHDYEVARDYLDSVERITGLERAHYDFAGGGYRFVVLDGNEISLFANARGSENHTLAGERLAALEAAGAPNARPWNGGISDAQFAWAEGVLADARAKGERVIVMGHYPLYPKDMHNMWDDDRLVELLTSHDNVVLYLNGHNHAGNYGRAGSVHFLNMKGMVETPDTTAYAVAEVHDDRIEIIGRGAEESRTLPL